MPPPRPPTASNAAASNAADPAPPEDVVDRAVRADGGGDVTTALAKMFRAAPPPRDANALSARARMVDLLQAVEENHQRHGNDERGRHEAVARMLLTGGVAEPDVVWMSAWLGARLADDSEWRRTGVTVVDTLMLVAAADRAYDAPNELVVHGSAEQPQLWWLTFPGVDVAWDAERTRVRMERRTALDGLWAFVAGMLQSDGRALQKPTAVLQGKTIVPKDIFAKAGGVYRVAFAISLTLVVALLDNTRVPQRVFGACVRRAVRAADTFPEVFDHHIDFGARQAAVEAVRALLDRCDLERSVDARGPSSGSEAEATVLAAGAWRRRL